MSAIYRIFIYVLDDNIASIVLFQNLGQLKTNTTKIPVLVLQLEAQGPCTGHWSIIAILHCFPLHEKYTN